MEVFLFTLSKLLPLYLVALIGYIAAKKLKLDFETLTRLFFYVFLPIVVFYGTYNTPIASGGLLLPLVYFVLATVISLVFLAIGKLYFKNKMAYLLSMTAGSNNIGNLGIPLSVAVFGTQAIGPAVMAVLGGTLWWSTLGFFIASKGHYSTKESLKRMVRLPALYAFTLGILFQLFSIPLESFPLTPIIDDFIHGYNILGFLIVGVGMAQITREAVDKAYLSLSLLAKFVAWPLLTGAIILIDSQTLRLLTPFMYKVFFLQSLCPIALNAINVASIVKLYPEKAALAVTVSTLLAIIYIPVMISIFIK